MAGALHGAADLSNPMTNWSILRWMPESVVLGFAFLAVGLIFGRPSARAQRRVAGALVAWLQGCPLPESRFPLPSAVEATYQALCRDVRAAAGGTLAFTMASSVVPAHLLRDDPAAVWTSMADPVAGQSPFSAAAATGRVAP